MSHRHLFHIRLSALLLGIALILSSTVATYAQSSTYITGTVADDGKPVSSATVTLIGNNLTLRATTTSAGAFAFNALTVGTYTVSAPGRDGPVATEVHLTSNGAEVTLDIAPIKEIGRVGVTRTVTSRQSGTDLTLTGTQLGRAAGANSIPDILAQLPTAARGSNGQIHVNGDHNGINYIVDGVQIPTGLNRALGNEVDPGSIGFLNVLMGAYPAQYGDKFAAVFDISTRAKSGPAGFNFDVSGGSYALGDSVMSFHTPVGAGGSLFLGSRLFRDGRALDPPVPNSVHNAGSAASQFVRLSLLVHGADTLTFDLSHSLQSFQIPPDTANGLPASTDDNQYQTDTFASLIYRHAIGDRGVLSFGPSFKRSRLLDTNDPGNDLAPAAGTVCTDFSNCGFFSVFADRTATDYRFNTDFVLRTGSHEIRAGALYGLETVSKNYAITLQAGNALSPAGASFTVTDTAPNVGHQQQFFLQDGWQMGSRWRLDYGVRLDAFQLFSTDFNAGFAQVSPRIKLTRSFSPRASVYAYYGRLFVPFTFENVAPTAASALFVPGTVTGTYDLRPQRDSLYELGGHLPLGAGDIGVRISHKNSTDYIDDTQVGATNLHQDINFPLARIDSQTLFYNLPTARGGRFYASLSHTLAVTSANCETQLLQNCAAAGPPGGDFVSADHDQHWDAATGFVLNEHAGGWLSLGLEYGSGLTQDPANCPPTFNAVNCKVPPHLTVDVAKGIPLGRNSQLALAVRNLFNDRYAITLDSALQGTHYARPRSVELRLFMGGR